MTKFELEYPVILPHPLPVMQRITCAYCNFFLSTYYMGSTLVWLRYMSLEHFYVTSDVKIPIGTMQIFTSHVTGTYLAPWTPPSAALSRCRAGTV